LIARLRVSEKKGEQTGFKLSIPRWGGYGGKIRPWNQTCTPRKEEKKY